MSHEKVTTGIPQKMALAVGAITDAVLSKVFWSSFLIAFSMAMIILLLVRKEEYLEVESEFNERVEHTHSRLLLQLNRHKTLLYSARSIYTALADSQKSEWPQMIRDLSNEDDNSANEGFGFVRYVPGRAMGPFRENHPSLDIHPVTKESDNCIITMYSNESNQRKALGYNVCSQPAIKKTLMIVRDTGLIKGSPPINLITDHSPETAIILYIPVYSTDIMLNSIQERQSNLVGWIGAPIKLDSLFHNSLSAGSELEFQLYKGPPRPQSLLFSHISSAGISVDFITKRVLDLDGEKYTVVYRQRNVENEISYSTPILILGLLFSFLAGWTIWALYAHRERALLLAKQMEESLVDSEDTVQKLLDSSPGAIYSHSYEEDWNISFVSDYIERLTGHPSEEFKKQSDFDDIIHPDDVERIRTEISEALSSGDLYEVEYRIIATDHSIKWVLDKGYLEKNNDIKFVRGVILDINKTKQIELKANQLNNALLHMAEGIALIDRRGTFVEVNQAFARASGWHIDEIPGLQVMIMLYPDDVEKGEHLFQQLLTQEQSQAELRGVKQDGSLFYVSLIFVGLYDDRNALAGAYLFMRDISERKKAEEDLRMAKEELSIAYKTKSDFLATMGHEMRTPLNVIIGYSEMIKEEVVSSTPGLEEEVESIKNAASHLLTVVNDIVDITKLESNHAEINTNIFDVSDLIENVISSTASLIPVNHNKLNVEMGEIGLMNSDFSKIRQNLMNLLSNAAKFTFKGHIKLEVQACGDQKDFISFKVTDTGAGIAKEKFEQIFTPFALNDTTEFKKGLGTGLGLAIVKRFSELLGGSLEVESEVGKGSSFEMQLPRGDVSEVGLDEQQFHPG